MLVRKDTSLFYEIKCVIMCKKWWWLLLYYYLFITLNLDRLTTDFYCFSVPKFKSKVTMKQESKGPEVCKDPVRLTSHAVGVNIFKEGEDPKLKPFEEYPEW